MSKKIRVFVFGLGAVIGLAALLTSASGFAYARTRSEETSCDASLWKRVYNPGRLTQLNACTTATGVIAESHADDDGDQHFLLDLDKGQKDLLNKRNKKAKKGDLVVEIVCVNPIKLKRVKHTCDGYRNAVYVPRVGAHVRVTGSYVIDGHNGWAEIHPASRIELIK